MTRDTYSGPEETSPIRNIAAVSITVDDVGLDRFEQICPSEKETLYQQFGDHDGVAELFVLRTCERFEWYLCGEASDLTDESIFPVTGRHLDSDVGQLMAGCDAIEHLFRVACGLESSVVGEDEILGQLRGAKAQATAVGALDGQLETTVQKAIHVGRRARSETTINEGTVSLGSIAVDRLRSKLDTFADAVMIVVGAGKFASLVLDAVRQRDDRPETILVANRSLGPAKELAAAVNGRAVSLADLPERIPTADVIVTATTSSTPILTAGDMQGVEAVVFDLGNPRDIDPAIASFATVDLTTLDELFDHQSAELAIRRKAIPAVEIMISEECSRLDEQLRAEQIDAVLARIRRRAEAVRQDELDHALARLRAQNANLSPQQEAVLQDFSAALVSKLLHTPTVSLRQAAVNGDHEAIDHALHLFDARSPGETGVSNKTEDRAPPEEDRDHLQTATESTSSEVS